VPGKKRRFLLISLFFAVQVFPAVPASAEKIEFSRLTASIGLSQDSVTSIIQDRLGLMWIGTADGLNRYDGNRFRLYKHHTAETDSLSDNFIETLFLDSTGDIWIGTNHGLDRFQYERESFAHYEVHDGTSFHPVGRIFAIAEDRSCRLWVASISGIYWLDRGRNCLVLHTDEKYLQIINSNRNQSGDFFWVLRNGKLWQMENGRLNPVQFFNASGSQLATEIEFSESIRYILHDRQENEWLCTNDGLFQLLPLGNRNYCLRHWLHVLGEPNSLAHNSVLSALQDDKGFLWIGTEMGLSRLDNWKNGAPVFTVYKHDSGNPSTLGGNTIKTLVQDQSGILWAGIYGGGVTKIVRKPLHFSSYVYDPEGRSGFKETSVLSICDDSEGALWLGGEIGLSRFDCKSGTFRFYYPPDQEWKRRSFGPLRALYDSGDGVLWIGGAHGLFRFDKKSGLFRHCQRQWLGILPGDRNYVRTIMLWTDGKLLLGTKAGLVIFDRTTETFTLFRSQWPQNADLNLFDIYTLRLDEEGTLWIGTIEHGLFGLSAAGANKETIRHFVNIPGNVGSLNNNSILCIQQQQAGVLWLGTMDGLCRLDTHSGRCRTYSEAQGMANAVGYGILADPRGFIWLSTNKGITRLDPQKEIFKNFFSEDGLANNEFNGGAFYRCRDGMMVFGGITGFTMFFPKEWESPNMVPPMVFVDFQVLSSKGKRKGDLLFSNRRGQLQAVSLRPDENSFSIEFAALDYTDPRKNEYLYKMDGIDEQWTYSGNRNLTTYTNLDPGYYRFRVKAAGAGGVWNERGLSLQINIKPPFWAAGWFRLLAALLIILFFFGLVKIRTKTLKQRLESRRLEKELKFKADLTAMIVHDLRTPLTCISGYAEILELYAENDRVRHQALIIRENAGKMLHLINEMLDVSKFEAGRMVIQRVKFDLALLSKDVAGLLQPLVEKKHLCFSHPETGQATVMADSDKIGQVMQNLLGNAVKYSPENSLILVTIDQLQINGKTFWEFAVADQGPGISSDHQRVLFNKYAQIQQPKMVSRGTGLGLAISKMIVEAHDGEIGYRPAPERGSIFFFRLPALS
jgi:signal transduction histidine kinase/ligand-binding sensor domain-containing protein